MLGKNRGKTRNVRPASSDEPHNGQGISRELVAKMKYPALPNQVGDELSFTRFAAPVAPQLMRDILKCKPRLAKSFPHWGICLILTKVDS